MLYQPGKLLSIIQASSTKPWLVSSMLASVHPAQISHSIGLSLTGSLDLLREALSLPILDLTLGRTTNKSFPQGAQCSIIHTDLPWLQFSFIFSQAEEEKPNHVLLMQRELQQFSQQGTTLSSFLFWCTARKNWFCSFRHKLKVSLLLKITPYGPDGSAMNVFRKKILSTIKKITVMSMKRALNALHCYTGNALFRKGRRYISVLKYHYSITETWNL